MDATQIVQHFYKALEQKDFSAVRGYLHDGLSFQGPIDTFHKAEPYLEAIKGLSKIVQRVDVKKMFVDGNDVCVLYDLVTNTPAGTSFVAEWIGIRSPFVSAWPTSIYWAVALIIVNGMTGYALGKIVTRLWHHRSEHPRNGSSAR